MARREGGASNDVLYMLGKNLFIAYPVLDGAHGRRFVESVSRLRNRLFGVNRFRGDDPIIAVGKLSRIAGCVKLDRDLGGAGKPQAVGADGVGVLFPDVVRPDFGLPGFCQVCGKQTAYRSTTDNQYPHS